MSSHKSKFILLASLLVNMTLCFLMLFQSQKLKEQLHYGSMLKDYSASLEEMILANVQFSLDISKWGFELFIQLNTAINPSVDNYSGVIIPSNPCQVCITKLLEVIDSNSKLGNRDIVIFLPTFYLKDFQAHFANSEVYLITYDVEDVIYSTFSEFDDLIIYRVVNNELNNYYKSFKQFPDLLKVIL